MASGCRFWEEYNRHHLEAEALRTQLASITTRYQHDLRELERLQKANVYSAWSSRHSLSAVLMEAVAHRRRLLHRARGRHRDHQRAETGSATRRAGESFSTAA